MRHVPKVPRRGLSGKIAGWRKVGTGRGGFTLVEVLVVLAVMVIVFGLLFAPMISGLNLVSRGRRHVAMQDAVRLALEQMKRDLAEAIYVFDPVVYTVTSMDGQPQNNPIQVVDYGTVIFVPAARDEATAAPLLPLRPYVADYGPLGRAIRAVRYTVHLVNRAAAHGPDNPFALFRQEGYVVQQAGVWRWAEGEELVENALTPRADVDLPPALSICTACHSAWTGYVRRCPDCGTDQALHYITDAVQFAPQRISGELLEKSSDGAVYRASMGGWLGTQNDGTRPFGPGLTMLGIELDPRIVVYRHLAGGLVVYLDTYTGDIADPYLSVKWDSAAGLVDFSEARAANVLFDLTPAPGGQYPVTITGDGRVYPTYAPASSDPWAPAPSAPITYVLDPRASDAETPAKIVDGSIGVRLRLTYGSGAAAAEYYYDFERVYTYDQNKIGPWQFCALLSADGTAAQVRFSRNNPPGPDWFDRAQMSGFVLELRYAIRRNFNPDNGLDDIVRADYSTRYVLNLVLTLASYVELEATAGNPAVFKLPPGVKVHRVEGRDRVVIHNAL